MCLRRFLVLCVYYTRHLTVVWACVRACARACVRAYVRAGCVAAFSLVFKDLRILYQSLNKCILQLLESYFDMPKFIASKAHCLKSARCGITL